MRTLESLHVCREPLPNQKSGKLSVTAFLVCALLCLATPAVLGQSADASAVSPQTSGTILAPQGRAASTGTNEVPASSAATLKPTAQSVGSAAHQSSSAASPKGGHEGITVHGHWIIDVRNPDGTLVTHREFENSIVTTVNGGNGQQLLTGLLGRTITAGSWEINLITSNNSIHIMEPNSTQFASCPANIVTCSPTLSEVPGNSVNPGVLTFAGFATVPTGQTSIVRVATDNFACPSTFLPSVCFNLNYLVASNGMNDYQFTSTTLSPAITITPGQVVQAQVNISFQ